MEFQEFPKMVYEGGKIEGSTRVVADEVAEADAAKDGFVELGASLAKQPKAAKA